MIDLRADSLVTVKEILKTHVPSAEVQVFGSRVSGTAKAYSDLDLAIVGTSKLDLKTLSNLREAFQESELPIRVDVVDWHAISDEFREVINQNNEVIQK